MSMNLSKTNVAFAKLLEIADGRFDLVEGALMEASRVAGNTAPDYKDVVAELHRRVAVARPKKAAGPEMVHAEM